MRARSKRVWLARLAEWEEERRTNRHGMQYLADRAIAVLKADIAYYWPDA